MKKLSVYLKAYRLETVLAPLFKMFEALLELFVPLVVKKIIDIGTGGGFPGIPLAIMFPEIQFSLCDSISKKIKVVTEVANAIGLQNVTPMWSRSENLKGDYDFVVSRGVTTLRNFVPIVKHRFHSVVVLLLVAF